MSSYPYQNPSSYEQYDAAVPPRVPMSPVHLQQHHPAAYSKSLVQPTSSPSVGDFLPPLQPHDGGGGPHGGPRSIYSAHALASSQALHQQHQQLHGAVPYLPGPPPPGPPYHHSPRGSAGSTTSSQQSSSFPPNFPPNVHHQVGPGVPIGHNYSQSDDDSGCALEEYTWVPPGLRPDQVSFRVSECAFATIKLRARTVIRNSNLIIRHARIAKPTSERCLSGTTSWTTTTTTEREHVYRHRPDDDGVHSTLVSLRSMHRQQVDSEKRSR